MFSWSPHPPAYPRQTGSFLASRAFGSGLGTLTIILEGRKRSKLCIIQKIEFNYMYRHMIHSLYIFLNKQEQIVLERSAIFNLELTRVTGVRDDHLQEASPSGWSFARGRSLGMNICKRPASPDDHLQEASPSRWSFPIGWTLWIIICKRPVPPDDHL